MCGVAGGVDVLGRTYDGVAPRLAIALTMLATCTIVLGAQPAGSTTQAGNDCGQTWTVAATPSHPDGAQYAAIAAPTPNTVVVVGYKVGNSGSPLTALVDRWDGTEWYEDTLPALSGSSQLSGVSGVSATDVWAVGTTDAPSALVLHWDGSSWTLVPTPVTDGTAWLESVDEINAADVWAAGVVVVGGVNSALVEHWDGSTWSVVSAAPGTAQPALDALSASNTGDIWAAGQAGASFEVQHGTGGPLAVVDDPTSPTPSAVGGLVALSPSDVWATGGAISSTATSPWARHWDGTSWGYVPVAVPPSGGFFRAVAGGSSNLWAVGYTPAPGSVYLNFAEHWDGSAWSEVPMPSPSATYDDATAAAVSPDQHLWVAGLAETATGVDGAVYSTTITCSTGGTVAPTVTAGPSPAVSALSVFGTSGRSVALPVTINWQFTPGSSPVCATQLQRSDDGGPWTVVSVDSPSATSAVDTLANPNRDVQYEVEITDCDGGSTGWVLGPAFKYNLFQESSNRWQFSPASAWRVAVSFHFSGRTTRFTNVAGAAATVQFYNADDVGLVMETGPHRGNASVSVDGGPPSVIGLNAPADGYRIIAVTASWPVSGPHVVQVTNLATPGSPRIDIDAAVAILGP